jgi:hypothetical protein
MYIHPVYIWYIHGYPWYILCRIYMVYLWISLDIPSFLTRKTDFSAGPCCWSHSMRTRLWVIKSVSYHAPPWQLCQGKGWPTKGSCPFLLPRRAPLPFAAFAAAGFAAASSSSSGPDASPASLESPPQLPPPPPPPPPPSALALALALAAAARASFLAVSRSRISALVSAGADGAGPSGLVRSVTYSARSCLRRECHAGSDMD